MRNALSVICTETAVADEMTLLYVLSCCWRSISRQHMFTLVNLHHRIERCDLSRRGYHNLGNKEATETRSLWFICHATVIYVQQQSANLPQLCAKIRDLVLGFWQQYIPADFPILIAQFVIVVLCQLLRNGLRGVGDDNMERPLKYFQSWGGG